MQWLKKLFSTHRDFIGDYLETGEDLLSLVASNEVVRAEYETFTCKIQKTPHQTESHATQSAEALSGYGIMVTPQAFIDSVGFTDE